MTAPEVSAQSATHLLPDVAAMVGELMASYGGTDIEVTMDTSFHEDLELESIDLVALAGMLTERYGPGVNLPEYLAEKDLQEIIALTIGDVVRYVASQTAKG
jgi:acyl carrier protein